MKKILCFALGILIIFSCTGCTTEKKPNDSNPTAIDIFNSMKKHNDFATFINEHENFTEETDPNKIMGQPNQYTSKVSWSVDKLNDNFDEKYNGGTIEVFKNENDAKMRSEFLKYYSDTMKEVFSEEEYGELSKTMWSSNKYVHQNGNVVMSIWETIDHGFPESYFKELDEELANISFIQVDSPTDEEAETMLNEKKAAFSEAIKKSKKEFDDGLNKEADKIDVRITNFIEGNYNENLDDIQKIIEKDFKINFYKNRYDDWKTRIDNICTLDNYCFKEGTYIIGEDIMPGTYTIKRMYGKGTLSILDNTVARDGIYTDMGKSDSSQKYYTYINDFVLNENHDIKIVIKDSLWLKFIPKE